MNESVVCANPPIVLDGSYRLTMRLAGVFEQAGYS